MWRRPWEQNSKISEFHENPGFSWKSEIFAKISDLGENFVFSRKSRISVKISDFRENPDFRQTLGFGRKFSLGKRSVNGGSDN